MELWVLDNRLRSSADDWVGLKGSGVLGIKFIGFYHYYENLKG